MTKLCIDDLIKKNDFILLDRSCIRFDFNNFEYQGIKQKVDRLSSEIKTMEYWEVIFKNLQENKFYLPEFGVNEFFFRKDHNYKKMIKKVEGRNFLEFNRLKNKERHLTDKLNTYFNKENIIKLNDEQKIVYNQILQSSEKEIIRLNENLKAKNKDILSEADIDYFLTTAVLDYERKKACVITNDYALFFLAGNFVSRNKEFNFGVYMHKPLGNFVKFKEFL